jgi:DNA-directed RNA polymerase sigma subunit (sigma70/sigma32)
MVNYYNGKVYKLVSFSSDNVYYGSTCSPLSKRLAGHKAHYKHWKAGKGHYITAFEIMKHPDSEIILVENINCESKEQLHAAERKHVENNTCVNKFIPGRTCKEYHQENRESINLKKKEKSLCECGNYSTRANAARHKRSKNHLKYLLSIAESDTEYSSESSEYIYDGVPYAKIVSL